MYQNHVETNFKTCRSMLQELENASPSTLHHPASSTPTPLLNINNTQNHTQNQNQNPTTTTTEYPKLLRRLANAISNDLSTCHNMMSTIIDPGQLPEGMMVHYGLSEDLDALKQLYYGLPDLLTQVVRQELQRVPRALASTLENCAWCITYMPQVGFVMKMKGRRLPEVLEECLPDYQFAFEGKAENLWK